MGRAPRTGVNQRPHVRQGRLPVPAAVPMAKRARLICAATLRRPSSSIPFRRRCHAKLRQEMRRPDWFHISFFLRGACVKGIRMCDTWKDQARRARTAQMVSPLPERSRCYQSGPKGEGLPPSRWHGFTWIHACGPCSLARAGPLRGTESSSNCRARAPRPQPWDSRRSPRWAGRAGTLANNAPQNHLPKLVP